ncbi:MAG: DUF2868 domain-containing protein [Thermodesulfobacteriota bacterium]
MRELEAQAVVLARAFEEADPQGVLLSARDRQDATEVARAAGGAPEAQAAHRAEHLCARLEAALPGLATVRRTTRVPLRLLLWLPLVSFLVGLASNELGPERRINILAFPLLALLAWNLLVYALLLGGRLVGTLRGRGRVATARTPGWYGAVGAVASFIAEHSLRRVRVRDTARSAIATRALRAYWRSWAPLVGPLVGTRVRATLHLAAASLALGAVAGMYVRGLTFEYRATWESTFIGADAAALLLRLVLGPAAALLGVPLPAPAELAAMRAPDGSAAAATWIHLWAVTALLVVLLPRTVLAALALLRERRLSRALPIEPLAGSFRALLAPDRGAGMRVDVLPYSYGVGGREADTLRELLHEVFGLRADVRIRATLAYGEDPPASNHGGHPACAVVVYGLVQSPEREVHGRFIEELARSADGGCVLAVIDSSAWRARFGEAGERRESERRRAWDRVLADVGLAPLHVDLAAPLTTDLLEQAEEKLATRGAPR